jgi:ATP-dependent Clp protease ATP-binding subunit ClpX
MTLEKLARSLTGRSVRCSFCGREHTPNRRLVSGPGVYICEDCVEHATRVLAETDAPLDKQ